MQFYASVRPLRRHEEVIVWTSIRPFEQMQLYDNVCNYCYRDIHTHDYSHEVVYPPERFHEREYRFASENGPPQNGMFYESSGYQKGSDREYNRKESTAQKQYIYTSFPRKYFEPPSAKVRPTIGSTIDERPEFEEICLHAIIHRAANRHCECKNCGDIIFDQKYAYAKEAEHATFIKGRRMSDPTLSVSKTKKLDNNLVKQVEARERKETLKRNGKESLKTDTKDKSKDAHILTRIRKAKDIIETSDTEISELSSKDGKVRKRNKFISEEDFKRKLEKAKRRKFQKQLVNHFHIPYFKKICIAKYVFLEAIFSYAKT